MYYVACSRVVPGSMQSAYTTSVAIGIEHVNDYSRTRFKIQIVGADLICNSIRTKISDLQVPS